MKLKKFKLFFSLLSIFYLILGGYSSKIHAQIKDNQNKKITYEGGSGDSTDSAIIIKGAYKMVDGTAAENAYLRSKYHEPGSDWQLVIQMILHKSIKTYHLMKIRLSDGTIKDIYFDVTEFFGKY
jgi:hypothetical protein